MRTKLYIIALLSMMVLSVSAQTFQPTVDNNAIQSQQMIKNGSTYKGTVYEPFTTTTPSEQSTVGASQGIRKSAIRKNGSGDPWGQNQDGGDTSEEGSPIGDAVVPLMLFALGFAGVLALRRRRRKSA